MLALQLTDAINPASTFAEPKLRLLDAVVVKHDKEIDALLTEASQMSMQHSLWLVVEPKEQRSATVVPLQSEPRLVGVLSAFELM